MASGSPKESKDLGVETIRGKPEGVCSVCPLAPQLCTWERVRRLGLPSWQAFLQALSPQTALLLGTGMPMRPGLRWASQHVGAVGPEPQR